MKACPLTRIQNFQHTYLLEFGLHPQKPGPDESPNDFGKNH